MYLELVGDTLYFRKQVPVRVNELARSQDRLYMELNGEWQFQLDPSQAGEAQRWFSEEQILTDTIAVPGCLEAQGKGVTCIEPMQPGWGQTSDVPFRGLSWYKKSFKVSDSWRNALNSKRIWLHFGGVSMQCRIWLNGAYVGEHRLAAAPFGFDVTDLVRIGAVNDITVQVENTSTNETSDFLETSHGFGAMTTEMVWTGIYRGVELVACGVPSIRELFVMADPKTGNVLVQCELDGEGELESKEYVLRADITPWGEDDQLVSSGCIAVSGSRAAIQLHVKEPKRWSDREPNLYRVTAALYKDNRDCADSLTERFGFRSITYDDTHILLNGYPVYLRGDMVHYHWPHTVSPSTDREELGRELAVYKAYGFNFLRHHTHFPGVEYLEVCDELGLLAHNELGVLMRTDKRKGNKTWKIREELAEEMWQALIRRDRNHPSVIVWCMGNESFPVPDDVKRFATLARELDPTRLIQSSSTGWFDQEDPERTLRYAPIYHECRKAGASYVDSALSTRYAGTLRPWRIQYTSRRLEEAGLKPYWPLFTTNTQKLQALCRKLVLEEIRQNDTSQSDYWNPGGRWEGYQLCTFRDSGSFHWGVVDDFFGQKAASPEETLRYNGETVLLWQTRWQNRLFRGESFVPFAFVCSHYGSAPIQGATFRWELRLENGELVAEGEHTQIDLSCGEVKPIGVDYRMLPRTEQASKLELHAELTFGGQGFIRNLWNAWLLPDPRLSDLAGKVALYGMDASTELSFRTLLPEAGRINHQRIDPNTLLISGALDQQLIDHVEQGGRALLLARGVLEGEVTEWGAGRSEFPRGTIIRDHPLFRSFPHKGWCDIPFASVMSGTAELDGNRNELGMAVSLRGWPEQLEPIIMGIPSYKQKRPQKLAHVFEVSVGRGKLLITSFRFDTPGASHVSAVDLLSRMLYYMDSQQFQPEVSVQPAFLASLPGRAQPAVATKKSH